MCVTLNNHTFKQIERALRAASSINPAMPIPFNTAQHLAGSAAYAEDLIRAERHAASIREDTIEVDGSANVEVAGANKLA